MDEFFLLFLLIRETMELENNRNFVRLACKFRGFNEHVGKG